MAEYFDMDGNPVDMWEWARLMNSEADARRIARTDRDGVTVSTVWLDVNHNYDPNGSPHIFETMVFGGEHDADTTRYSTRDEALRGHESVCAMVWP